MRIFGLPEVPTINADGTLKEKEGLIFGYMHHDIPEGTSVMCLHGEDADHLFIDDMNYHINAAQNVDANADFYAKEAARAAERGDYCKAKDYQRMAESYRQQAADPRV